MLPPSYQKNGGEGNRTPDLVNAIHALSQLSYAPAIFGGSGSRDDGNTASYRTVKVVSTDRDLRVNFGKNPGYQLSRRKL